MGNRVQPGGRVDEETYNRFREFVRRQHGAVRGNLGAELETAMEERMDTANGADRLTRIESDVATIKAQLADAQNDGGEVSPTPSTAENTRARGTAKPAANQPRSDKYEYLFGELFDTPEASRHSGEVATKLIRNIVTDAYQIDKSIVDEYVSDIEDRLRRDYDADPHPVHGQTLVWGDRLDEAREAAHEDARDDLDDLDEGA